MAFDLSFIARRDQSCPTEEQWRSYFEGRQNYFLTDRQICYANANTGVYFWLADATEELAIEVRRDLEREGYIYAGVTCSLNLGRPSIFVRECALEMQRFAAQFALAAADLGTLIHYKPESEEVPLTTIQLGSGATSGNWMPEGL
jgi:hypothetical protein